MTRITINMDLIRNRTLAAVGALTLLCSQAAAQDRSEATLEVNGGRVTVDYTTTKLAGRSAEDIPVGTFWRMSKDAAAQLTTTVPLASRKMVLAPGRYRISAHRKSVDRWELVLFQGSMLFSDGMSHEKHSLRLDDEEESAENLKFVLKKSRKAVRIKLHWGKHSLNTRFTTLPLTRVEGTLAGKPAIYSFYGIDVGKNQQKFTSGSALTIGSVALKTDNPVRYTIHAERKGNSADLIFKNTTIAKVGGAITANQKMQKRMKDFMVQANDAQAQRMKSQLADMERQMQQLQSVKQAAASLKRNVRISAGEVQEGQAGRELTVEGKENDGNMKLTVSFGAKRANFTVKASSFKKEL